jgi:hypothetical protein
MVKKSVNSGKYQSLKLKCYVCKQKMSDHISIECPKFKEKFEGNIKTYFEKIRQQSKYSFTLFNF